MAKKTLYPIKIHADPYGNPYVYSTGILDYVDAEGWIDAPVHPCHRCYPNGFTGTAPEVCDRPPEEVEE